MVDSSVRKGRGALFQGFDLFGEYDPDRLALAIKDSEFRDDTARLINIGIELSKTDESAALRFFLALSQALPKTIVVWRNVGHCSKSFRNFGAAANAFLKAYELGSAPKDLLDASVCFLEAVAPDQAISCAQGALSSSALAVRERAVGHYVVGRGLVMKGEFSDAKTHLLDALGEDPSLAPAAEYLLISAANCADLAAVTDLIGQMDNAGWLNKDLIQVILEVLIKKSHYSSVIDVFKFTSSRLELSASSYHLAIEAARAMGRFEDAYSLMNERKKLFPEFTNLGSIVSEIHTLGQLARVDEKQRSIEAFMEYLNQRGEAALSLNPWLLFSFLDDPLVQLESARGYSAEVLQVGSFEDRSQTIKRNKLAPGKRPVIGFYGAEFRNHPVADCLRPILRYKERFCDVALFYNHFYSDSVTTELKGYAEHFVDCAKLDFNQTKKVVNELGVDLLIDLSVHTAGGRPDFFAKRLAPIQVSYLGFSGTSGCVGYDYLFADHYITPPDSDYLYSEELIRLDNSLLSMNVSSFNEDRRDEERARLGLPVGSSVVVFGFLAQSYKLTKEVAESISEILKMVPQSRLMLPEKSMGLLQHVFLSHGVEKERLISSDFRRSRADHLARLSACDLLLDSFPYNAHSLAADAISAGTPVLALAGRSFASRVSGSLMCSLGFPQLVSSTIEGYVARATELGRDPGELTRLRADLLKATKAGCYDQAYPKDFYSKCYKVLNSA